MPYDGDVSITCAPATTPTLDLDAQASPAPSVSPADDDAIDRGTDDATRAPVASSAPVVGATQDGEDDSNTGVIAGSVAGGVALLAIAGVVAYKLKKPTPPPPSYDDLVGSA